MRTIEYLSDPNLRPIYLPALVGSVLVALMCAPLSVLVVLRRLAFIGQGVSHSAFAGVGLALVLGFGGSTAASSAGSTLGMLIVISVFAVLVGLWIAVLGERLTSADTAIGIVLACCMAAGFELHRLAGQMAAEARRPAPESLESILFGSFLVIGPASVAAAGAVLGVVVVTLWLLRRPVLFWAFDEDACSAFGVRALAIKLVLYAVLAVVVVLTMRLAGVVLATALLVLPGAIALAVSDRLWRVLAIAAGAGLLGSVAGVVVSFETDLQTGPAIVGVLALLYGLAKLAERFAAPLARAVGLSGRRTGSDAA